MDTSLPTPLEQPLRLPAGRVLRLSPLAEGGHFDPRRAWSWRRPWGLSPAPGVALQVLQGAVWLTWPGCEDDLFLRAGQTMPLPASPWGSARAIVDGVLVEAEPRLSPGPALVRLARVAPGQGRWQVSNANVRHAT